MRLILRAAPVALALAAALTGVASAQSTFKIAYVNTQVLLQNAPGRVEAEAAFNKDAQGYQEQLKRMSDSLNSLITAYNKAEPTLTQAQKDTRTNSIRALEQEFQGKQQELQQQASERQNQLMAPIMEEVKKVLEDIRKEDGYAMIIANDPGQSVIVASDKNLDITDRVVARLKTVAAPKATPATVAPKPSGVTRPKVPNE